MSKPDSVPVPEADRQRHVERRNRDARQEPLAGSKKVKQENHSRHNNGEG